MRSAPIQHVDMPHGGYHPVADGKAPYGAGGPYAPMHAPPRHNGMSPAGSSSSLRQTSATGMDSSHVYLPPTPPHHHHHPYAPHYAHASDQRIPPQSPARRYEGSSPERGQATGNRVSMEHSHAYRQQQPQHARKVQASDSGASTGKGKAKQARNADRLNKRASGSSVKRGARSSVSSDEDDELDNANDDDGRSPASTGADKGKASKRRRVVVACDTCRRKKVKCEGLPNPTNTCKNCQNMGYTCAFTVEPDRSRGKYEILESQRDTLLTALRSVAPELAAHFERGELHIANPSGSLLPLPQAGQQDEAAVHPKDYAPHGAQRLIAQSSAAKDTRFNVIQRDLGPMVPDLEDGRPRYYGGSSSLRSFNELESRPSSPGAGASTKRSGEASGERSYAAEPGESSSATRPRSGTNSSKSRFAVLPPPMPLFPSNSIGWVREMRKKTLVAIGRDEIFASEGWFNRHPLPEADLLNDLLDYYFRNLNPMLPILHEATLRRDIDEGRANRDSAFRGLVFTILAIASRFVVRFDKRVLADPEDEDSAGDHWAAASRFHHQVYAASLINVQMLILACAFMPSSLGIGTSWTVLGVAIRALQDIGLHTEKAYGGYTPFDQERRRRTFWAAVIMDGLLSINMGRPTAVRLSDTYVYLPSHCTEAAMTEAERTGGPVKELASGDQTPCVVAGFIHLIKAGTIIRDVVDTLYAPAAVQLSSASKVVPSYKDMTILSKRLDEWNADIPEYLRDVNTSPFPAQASYVLCGRNNIRLYILKPFLYDFKAAFPSVATGRNGSGPQEDGSILRKMLLPQCTKHARSSLWALKSLHEDVGVPIHFFILHQGLLSASTFLMTVWHGTRDAETLCEDRDIIEFGLRVFNAEAKFATILLKRAHRILRNIALRALPALQDEAQRKRMQDLLRHNGSAMPLAPATLRAAADGAPRSASWTPTEIQGSTGRRRSVTGDATFTTSPSANVSADRDARAGQVPQSRPVGETFAVGPAMTTMAMMTPRLQSGTPLSDSRWAPSPFPRPALHSPSLATHRSGALQYDGAAMPVKPGVAEVGEVQRGNASAREAASPHRAASGPSASSPRQAHQHNPDTSHALDALDVRQWLPTSEFENTLPHIHAEPTDGRGGFEFTGDLSWTDYFSRFLGGLPDPSAANMPSAAFGTPIPDQLTPTTMMVPGLAGANAYYAGMTPGRDDVSSHRRDPRRDAADLPKDASVARSLSQAEALSMVAQPGSARDASGETAAGVHMAVSASLQ